MKKVVFLQQNYFANNLRPTKIHVDATYKLVLEVMPVLMNDTADMDRHFHTYGFSVCTNKRTTYFAFIFKSIVREIR